MFKKSGGLRLHELSDHIAQHGPDCIKPLIRGADVVESVIIQQNLLHDEYGDSLAKLRASLHNAKAQRYYLCGEKKVDDIGRIILDQGANDAKAREPQILKGPRFRRSIEEGIQEERNMGYGTHR